MGLQILELLGFKHGRLSSDYKSVLSGKLAMLVQTPLQEYIMVLQQHLRILQTTSRSVWKAG